MTPTEFGIEILVIPQFSNANQAIESSEFGREILVILEQSLKAYRLIERTGYPLTEVGIMTLPL